MIKKMIRIHEADNVGIAVEGAREGDNLVDDQVNCVATMDIPVNHKIALQDFEEGDIIYKYGNKIGFNGSLNESENGLKNNFESIDTYGNRIIWYAGI